MPSYSEQEDFDEGMSIFFNLVFDKVDSGRMSVQEAGRHFPPSRHFEDESDFETWDAYASLDEDESDFDTWDAYASLDEELMILNDPNHHWDDVQERMTLRKKPKYERILKS